MKNILFSCVIILVALYSCNKETDDNLLSKDDSNLNVSTSLSFNFPFENENKGKLAGISHTDSNKGLLTSKYIKLEKWHSLNSENLFNGNWITIDQDGNRDITQNKRIKTDAKGMLEISKLSLGFNSFRAEYISIPDYNAVPLNWQMIPTSSNINDETKYKHYVGITKGVMDKQSTVDNANNDFVFDFIPLNNSNTDLWGASSRQAIPFEIKSSDVERINSNKAVFKKTIVMEMTPKNSVFDLKFRNTSKNLYIAVVVRDERTDAHISLNPDVVQIIRPDTRESRFILNTSEIVAGAKLSCRLYVLERKNKSTIYFDNSFNHFNIINGEGSILFNDIIKGNQRYFVKKKSSSSTSTTGDDMETITLTDDNFTSLGNILVFCHNSLQNNALKWNSWN
ncbi:MAG: hypothetical protein WBG43_12500 [Marinifilaceae bacterium]